MGTDRLLEVSAACVRFGEGSIGPAPACLPAFLSSKSEPETTGEEDEEVEMLSSLALGVVADSQGIIWAVYFYVGPDDHVSGLQLG